MGFPWLAIAGKGEGNSSLTFAQRHGQSQRLGGRGWGAASRRMPAGRNEKKLRKCPSTIVACRSPDKGEEQGKGEKIQPIARD